MVKRPVLSTLLSALAGLLLLGVFFGVSLIGSKLIQNEIIWIYVSGGLRLLTGIAAAVIFSLLFGKERLRETLGTKGIGKGLLSAVPLMLFSAMCLAVFFIGLKRFTADNIWGFVGDVFLITLMTSFFEEMVFRGLMIEGYFHIRHQNRITGIAFALFSAVIFVVCHTSYYGSPSDLLNLFALGFSLAVVFMCSRNILLCTMLHYLYDIAVCLIKYGENENSSLRLWIYLSLDLIYLLMAVVAIIIILCKKPDKTDKTADI